MNAFDAKLDFWIANDLNVIIEGGHGVGKTAVIEAAFKRAGLNLRYFSAATMDPWVDFIGVPKEKVHDDGTSSLELIRPLEFQDGSVDAIFFDEFNRAPPKIRNSVMEMLQKKSVNGKPIPKLRMIWAAINPSDDEETYDVEPIDPAQFDRFHIQTSMPSTPDRPYFIRLYGDHVGNRAVEWWHSLPEDVKHLVSPRRLDYAVDIFQKGGDLRDVLARETRPLTLKQRIERITSSSSHSDRWLTDPELYMSEVSNRSKDNPIDVVEAFTELRDISMETATAYVSLLAAPKINELAADNRTVGIVLRAIRDKRGSRQLMTAISRTAVNYTHATEDAENRLQNIKATDQELYAAAAACTNKAISIQHDVWKRLCIIAESRMDQTLLEYDDCMMLFILLADSGESDNQKTAGAIIRYVEHEHHASFIDFVRLRPPYACKVF